MSEANTYDKKRFRCTVMVVVIVVAVVIVFRFVFVVVIVVLVAVVMMRCVETSDITRLRNPEEKRSEQKLQFRIQHARHRSLCSGNRSN